MRHHVIGATRIAGAALLLATLVPGAAQAAPNPDSCASNTAQTYTEPVPAGMRTTGTHHVQWKSEFIDAITGEDIVDDSIINQITIDASAPAYPAAVLIRLFRNTALVNKDVVLVDAIRPTQEARLYVNVSWLKKDKFFVGAFRLWYRYETTPGHWSAYAEISPSPEQSFCVEVTSAIWSKGYGWD
jgi:hypothetical protein